MGHDELDGDVEREPDEDAVEYEPDEDDYGYTLAEEERWNSLPLREQVDELGAATYRAGVTLNYVVAGGRVVEKSRGRQAVLAWRRLPLRGIVRPPLGRRARGRAPRGRRASSASSSRDGPRRSDDEEGEPPDVTRELGVAL